VPLVRTEGSAKHDLLDGHGNVCHVPPTQVAVSPCMHAVSPAVKPQSALSTKPNTSHEGTTYCCRDRSAASFETGS